MKIAHARSDPEMTRKFAVLLDVLLRPFHGVRSYVIAGDLYVDSSLSSKNHHQSESAVVGCRKSQMDCHSDRCLVKEIRGPLVVVGGSIGNMGWRNCAP